MNIVILSASVRTGRNSHRLALYFENYLNEHQLAKPEILDLDKYNFPIFNERLRFQKEPIPQAITFSEKIKAADGVIIVTPEYNGGYPASLKNVTDLLYDEWKRKPIALVTVSAGPFGGSQVLTSLLFTLWKIGAWVIPAMFPVPDVEKNFSEIGAALDKEKTDKRAGRFIEELLWCMQAKKKMTEK